MAERTIVDELDEYTKRAESIVNDFTAAAVIIAKEVHAPIGATSSLREGIVAQKATKEKRVVVGVITSSAENNGFDYAELQHDAELFHAVSEGQPHFLGFADLGLSGTPQVQYWQGYAAEKARAAGTQNRTYATKYLDKALEDIRPKFDAAIEAEL